MLEPKETIVVEGLRIPSGSALTERPAVNPGMIVLSTPVITLDPYVALPVIPTKLLKLPSVKSTIPLNRLSVSINF